MTEICWEEVAKDPSTQLEDDEIWKKLFLWPLLLSRFLARGSSEILHFIMAIHYIDGYSIYQHMHLFSHPIESLENFTKKNEIWKIFLRRFPLSLAKKPLRVNKPYHEKVSQKICCSESTLGLGPASHV